MIDRFNIFLRRVFSDIKHMRNIEIYVVSALALLLVVVSLIADDLPEKYITAAMLAGISLLVFHISVPQNNAVSLDDYLNDRSSLTSFSESIKDAQKLWIYAPSAANILNQSNANSIRSSILSQKEGEFRIIIQNPNERAAVDILKRQLDDSVDFQMQYMEQEIQRTIEQCNLIAKWKVNGNFDFRLLDYGPGFSMVAIDPHKSSGKIIVEIHGFHNETTDSRMHITMTMQNSERWYTYWKHQFENMWDKASPPQSL